MIRLFQPTLGNAELNAVSRVFEDQWPGTGQRVQSFEREFAHYVGSPADQMIALTSCTEGLFQAVSALELSRDAEIVLPTISFIGAAHAVQAAGAQIRLADVDRYTLNPRPTQLAEVISPKTKGIILLHYGGQYDELGAVAELARQQGITLIEDSACGLGSFQNGRAYGAFGDIGIWSFDAMKLLVTGDGGMVRISDPGLFKKVNDSVSLGGVQPGHSVAASGTPWWTVDPPSVGRKARMNDLAASIGLTQLQRLETFISRRREIAALYDHELHDLEWLRLRPSFSPTEVPYFYWIQTTNAIRDKLASYLRANEIYTTFRYWPLHRTSLYSHRGQFPEADLAADTTLLLPIHQNLKDEDIIRIAGLVRCFRQ